MKVYNHQGHGGGYESGTQHFEELFTGAACKAAGGDWKGGHDVSGHVFMLVLATAVLAFEAVGAGVKVFGMGLSNGEGENVKEKADSDATGSADGLRVWTGRFVVGVIGLGWWMLFMTAIWFHTWLEKVRFLSPFILIYWVELTNGSGLVWLLPLELFISSIFSRRVWARGGISLVYLVYRYAR